MYRPKGWRNGYSKEREEDGMLSRYEIFEAGADAILEALRKDRASFENPDASEPLTFDLTKKQSGMWVFIPEED